MIRYEDEFPPDIEPTTGLPHGLRCAMAELDGERRAVRRVGSTDRVHRERVWWCNDGVAADDDVLLLRMDREIFGDAWVDAVTGVRVPPQAVVAPVRLGV